MKIHPNDWTLEDLVAFPEEANGELLDHLDRCAPCRERLRAAAAAVAATPEADAAPAGAAMEHDFERLVAAAESLQAAIAGERRAAQAELPRLLALPPAARTAELDRATAGNGDLDGAAHRHGELGNALARAGAPGRAAAHNGAPERAAAHNGAPGRAAAHNGAPERAAAHDGALESAPGGLATWGLLELLVERAREESLASPRRGQELAELALEVAARVDSGRYRGQLIEDMRARAWGVLGNARRLLADLAGAERALDTAHDHLRRGSQDPLERAALLDLRASLRRDQRRLGSAARLWQRAFDLFLELGERHRAGRTLVSLSTVENVAGRPEHAIALLYRALELVDVRREPRVLLCARHDLIDDLADAGRFAEAERLLAETLPLYETFEPHEPATRQRRRWVEAKLAAGRRDLARAEGLFAAARDGFLAAGMVYDAALVTLDLAALYFQQERHADLRRVAEEMLPTFAGLDLHREARAALAFLRTALEAERANRELLTTVASY